MHTSYHAVPHPLWQRAGKTLITNNTNYIQSGRQSKSHHRLTPRLTIEFPIPYAGRVGEAGLTIVTRIHNATTPASAPTSDRTRNASVYHGFDRRYFVTATRPTRPWCSVAELASQTQQSDRLTLVTSAYGKSTHRVAHPMFYVAVAIRDSRRNLS